MEAMEATKRIGGKSRLICTDDEGAIGANLCKEYVKGPGVELHRVGEGACFCRKAEQVPKGFAC